MNPPHTPAVKAEFGRLDHLRFFSPAIEARFETDGREQRLRSSSLTVLVAVAVYDVFLVADWQIMSDMVGWLAVMRLGVFTPLALLVFRMLPRTSKSWQVDTMTIGCIVLAVLFPTTAMVFSHSPYVLIYQFGSMATITYFTLVQRVRFRMAVIGLVAALTVQFWCVALRPDIDVASCQFVVSFYLSGAALLLMGSFVLERTERHGFPERLRAGHGFPGRRRLPTRRLLARRPDRRCRRGPLSRQARRTKLSCDDRLSQFSRCLRRTGSAFVSSRFVLPIG